eukprot:Gb_29251 [translate_table: standard]
MCKQPVGLLLCVVDSLVSYINKDTEGQFYSTRPWLLHEDKPHQIADLGTFYLCSVSSARFQQQIVDGGFVSEMNEIPPLVDSTVNGDGEPLEWVARERVGHSKLIASSSQRGASFCDGYIWVTSTFSSPCKRLSQSLEACNKSLFVPCIEFRISKYCGRNVTDCVVPFPDCALPLPFALCLFLPIVASFPCGTTTFPCGNKTQRKLRSYARRDMWLNTKYLQAERESKRLIWIEQCSPLLVAPWVGKVGQVVSRMMPYGLVSCRSVMSWSRLDGEMLISISHPVVVLSPR